MSTTKHATKALCPRCAVNTISHVHCANVGCSVHIHVCDVCDRAQAVAAFMADHAKDCPHRKPRLALAA